MSLGRRFQLSEKVVQDHAKWGHRMESKDTDHWLPFMVGPCLIRGLSVYTDLLNTKTEPISQTSKTKLERKNALLTELFYFRKLIVTG